MDLQRSERGGIVGRAGVLLILCGPAGVGKDAVRNAVCARQPELGKPVSTTSRKPRPGEIDGQDYHFVTREEFKRRIAKGAFLEFAEVHGNYYGVERQALDEAFRDGRDLLTDVSIDGAKNIKRALGERVSVIFLIAPTFFILRERMLKRGTKDPLEVETRLQTAREEIRRVTRERIADFLLVSETIEKSTTDVLAILNATRLRFSCQGLDAESYLAAC